MSKIFSLLFISLIFESGSTQSCISCVWSIDSPTVQANCYDYASDSDISTPSLGCAPNLNPYCQTQFTFEDGVITSVFRGCSYGTNDFDDTTDGIPTDDKCISRFNRSSETVDSVVCQLSCSENNCNNQSPANLRRCSVDCGANGRCNYITGSCACNEGYTGATCNTVEPPASEYLECVQCDSESNPDCETLTQTTPCINLSYRYCAVTTVMTLGSDGNSVANFISRSCSEVYKSEDECFLTSDEENGSGYLDYTCVSSCDTDGCNTGTPNGGNERELSFPLRCVVCSGSDLSPDCAYKTATDICPSSATHCESKVNYYVSDFNNHTPEVDLQFRIVSVERGCSSTPIMRECMQSPVAGTNLKEVTCSENCTEDGCNTGWPARVRCSQCSCEQCNVEDECFSNPALPSNCELPYHEYCVLEDLNRDMYGRNRGMIDGFSRSISRRCSHVTMDNQCNTVNFLSTALQSCTKSCAEDGCNLGFSEYDAIPTEAPITTTSGSESVVSTQFTLFLAIACAVVLEQFI